jgi:hypothetical protein
VDRNKNSVVHLALFVENQLLFNYLVNMKIDWLRENEDYVTCLDLVERTQNNNMKRIYYMNVK